MRPDSLFSYDSSDISANWGFATRVPHEELGMHRGIGAQHLDDSGDFMVSDVGYSLGPHYFAPQSGPFRAAH
jgi:hypothetical protein